MTDVGYRILLVEDEESDAKLMLREFEKESAYDQLVHLTSAQALLNSINGHRYDLLIVDYSLPDLNGLALMEELARRNIDIPVVIVTGHGDEKIAVQAMKLGAADYIVKSPNFTRTLPTVAHKAIERNQLKKRFDEAEAHLHFQALLLDNVHDAIIGTDLENEIVYWNHGAERIFGYAAEAILGYKLSKIFPDANNQDWQEKYQRLLESNEVNYEWQGLTEEGRQLWLSTRARLITDAQGRNVGVLNVSQDITEQKKLQHQTDLQIKHTATINQLFSVITATAGVEEMLPKVVELLVNAFDCDLAWIEYPCVGNAGAKMQHIEAGAYASKERRFWADTLGNELANEVYNYLIEHGEHPVELSEREFPQGWREFLDHHGVKSHLMVIVRPESSSPWVLGLWHIERSHIWSETERELLDEIARIITVALEKSLLYQRAREAAARERLINSITRELSQSLDINKILKTICNELGRSLNVDRCYFAKIEDDQFAMITHDYCAPGMLSWVGNRYQRAEFALEVAEMQNGGPLVIDSYNFASYPTIANVLEPGGIKSLLAVPVINKGKRIGAIGLHQCSYMRRWTEDEISLMEAISRQCAIALNNAELYTKSRKSEERYRSLFDNANDAIIIADIETGAILDANSRAETLTGSDLDTLHGLHLTDLHPESERKKYQDLYRVLTRTRRVHLRDAAVCRNDNTIMPVELSASVIGVGQGAVIQAILRDMAEQRKLETQLFHAQRLESIGTLTGGIAHDFNNLLAGILGYAELFKKKLDPSSGKLYNYATIIEQSATHGAELAQRLVAFARGGNLKPTTLDLNVIAEDTLKLLSRALGRTIEVQSELSPNLNQVEANATQVQQVLMNLCINARDAMPEGGRLKVRTENFHLDDDAPTIGPLRPGNYVMLAVSDNGIGMDELTRERIFEPFFTTKEIGKGTGLGLAMVATIIKDAHGHIEVESEVGKGTTFRIFLPAAAESVEEDEQQTGNVRGGNETILVVDDEETLRYLAKDLLEAYGYRVLLAADGLEALDIYGKNSEEISLVLLDMVMPKMGGREIYHKLIEINPKAKVVLASGYCPPDVIDQIWTEGIMGFVQKPYQIEDLAAELRAVLDGHKQLP